MTNATKFFQGFEEFVLEFSTLIMMDFGWKPKVKDVVVVQLFSHSLCRFVSGRVGEVINNHKDIPVPSTGLLKVDKIDRNQLEGGGSDNRLQWCSCLGGLCLRLLHMMNVRFSLLNMAQRILGVTLPNF
jgi:hypothetical protein